MRTLVTEGFTPLKEAAMFKPRNNNNLSNARKLRKDMTKEERHLWFDFLHYCTPRFCRQELIGNYIADFYCCSGKIVIELDGSQHTEENAVRYDAERSAYFDSLGIAVLRYSNIDVQNNFSGVCQNILDALKTRNVSPELRFPD